MSGRQRVGIIGAGAVGTVFAHALAERCDVTLVDVRPEVVDGITAAGGVAVEGRPVRAAFATHDPARAYSTSALFIFVKAPYTLGAIRPFSGKLNPATPIVSLQNGLGNEEAIKAALGGAVPLVVGATEVGGLTLGPGRSRRTEAGSTVIGSAGASTGTVQAIATLLEAAGFPTSVAYDIRPHLWGKLLVNATINPIAAIAGAPNGFVATDSDAIELGRAGVRIGRRRKGRARRAAVRRSVGVRALDRAGDRERPELDDGRSRVAAANRDRSYERRDRRGRPALWCRDALQRDAAAARARHYRRRPGVNMPTSPTLRAVIFDMDGVLIDSEGIWEAVRREFVPANGGTVTPTMTTDVMGMSAPEWSRYLRDVGGVRLSEREISDGVVRGMRAAYRTALPLYPGAVEAVRRLAARVPLAIASASNRELIELVVERAGLGNAFGAIVSAEEVGRGKPAPDVYLRAAELLGVPAASCGAVEDSSNGIRAAVAAGCWTVAIPNPEFGVAADALASASAIVGSVAEVTPALFGL